MARLKVTQTKSAIGGKQNQRDTLRTLGLKRIGDVVVKENRPEIRGMVATVAHLVSRRGGRLTMATKKTEAEEKVTAAAPKAEKPAAAKAASGREDRGGEGRDREGGEACCKVGGVGFSKGEEGSARGCGRHAQAAPSASCAGRAHGEDPCGSR